MSPFRKRRSTKLRKTLGGISMVKRASAGKTEAMLASIYYPNGPIGDAAQSEDQQDLFYAHIDNENFDAAKTSR